MTASRGGPQDVARRRHDRKALRETESRYREMVEFSPVGIYESTLDGKIEEANAAFARMLGYDRAQDLRGLDMAADVYAEKSERAAFIEKFGSLEKIAGVETQFKRKDGSHLWVQLDVRAISDASAKPLRFQGFVRDIQQRKEAEEALHRSERRFRSLIEASRDAIAVIGPDGVLTYASPSAESLAGYRPEELVGGNAFALVHPEDLPRLKARLAEILVEDQSDVPVPMSFRLRHRDGRWRFFEVVASNHTTDPALRGFVLSLRDVTDRKETEEANQKLLLAVEQAGSVILMTDPDGNISYVNPAFEKVYGYTRREVLGRNPRILKSGRHDESFYEDFWRRLLAGERVDAEIINKRQDGQLVTLEVTVTPVSDPDGRRVGFIAVQDDVTEKRLLEDRLRQSQKMEAIGELAGGIAHDFNNLLTVILGFTEIATTEIDEGSPLSEPLEEIQKAGERATSLTRQLLAFSRRQVLEPQVLDLNALVTDLEKMLRRLIGEDVQLTTVLDPDLGRVLADAGQIEQVVMNLAVNARDAMPRGGKLTVETSNIEIDESYASQHIAVRPGSYVMLAVTDTGTGMSEETKSRMFEPFFTTKGQGKGTGLGLATVYGIVKQSGGNIWAYSELQRGTTFKVYLPLVRGASTNLGPRLPDARSTHGSETVLLVEDEPAVRTLARKILERYGYTVLEVDSGEAAVEMARSHGEPIHLLLTDVVMPEVGGPDLAARIVTLRPGVRLLFMSGYTDDTVVRHGTLAEGAHFLQKPFTPDDLARKVRKVLDLPTPG